MTESSGQKTLVTVERELLIEAAEKVQADAELFVVCYGDGDALGEKAEFSDVGHEAEYNRLTDLARRLREAAE